MAGKKLFVGNLPWKLSSGDLENMFAEYGEVVSARVITDRDTGRSKGFGFVEYGSEDQAAAAMQAMDGRDIEGRPLRVSEAQERQR